VTVRLDVRDHRAALRVSDTGIGIAPDHLGRVFDRFWRSPEARERTLDGSGVGLALVRDLVQAQDGRIEVESRLGRGSTFTVYLPLARETEEEAARAARRRAAVDDQDPDLVRVG
jgi:signal transduction histidine kinase